MMPAGIDASFSSTKESERDREDQPEILDAIASQPFQSYKVHGGASVAGVYR
jgi:hypothetical protein